MIISRTPLRVSFFGGGSDLPAHYRRRGGAVLSITIEPSVYVTVSRKFDEAVRVSYSRTEEVAHASQVVHPLVREGLAMLGIEGGVEITSVADIPAKGTGLGSSSSFTVGLLNALHAYQGRHAPALRLAEESCRIEIERCGEPIGKQDQFAAAFGGFNFIRFREDDSVEVRKVICPAALLAELQGNLLFFYTGVTRSSSTLLQKQSAAVAEVGVASDATARLAALAEDAFQQISNGQLGDFGGMLHEAWALKRSLGEGISSDAIDGAYEASRRAGAIGGKLLGAGGGGFLMIYAETRHHRAVRDALRSLREVQFRFAPQGSSIIFVH